MRKLVIIPTYNEIANISPMIDKVMSLNGAFDLLIIDDGSPDGTADVVRRRQQEFGERLFMIERRGKLGLGTAYLTGFRWALERGYDYVFEMDCDFSHNPDDLERLYASAVGEVNVVAKMKETGAVIGGEGNGGVIYPACHYGRDALVGIALILSHMAREGKTASQLRASYPPYFMAKNRVELAPDTDVDALLQAVKAHYAGEEINDADGVKIDFPDSWVHLRRSNTEPIVRVYSEAPTQQQAEELGEAVMRLVEETSARLAAGE